jgi:hypothetical protein
MIHGSVGLVLPELRILVRVQSLAEMVHAMQLVEDTERYNVCGVIMWKVGCWFQEFGRLFSRDPGKPDFRS